MERRLRGSGEEAYLLTDEIPVLAAREPVVRHDEGAHERLLLLVHRQHVHRMLALKESRSVDLVERAWLEREQIERHADRGLVVGDQNRVDRVRARRVPPANAELVDGAWGLQD